MGGDVTAVTVILTPSVHQHQGARVKLAGGRDVVDDGGVVSGGHDWRVGEVRGPRHARLELQAGQELALRVQLSGPHHRPLESQASYPAGFSHQVHLGRGLDHPHVMKDGPGGWRSHKIFSSFNIHHSPWRFNKVDIFHFLQKVEDSFVSVRIPRLKVIIPNVEL